MILVIQRHILSCFHTNLKFGELEKIMHSACASMEQLQQIVALFRDGFHLQTAAVQITLWLAL